MQRVKLFSIAFLAGLFLLVAPQSRAQLSISVNIGPQPVCPYGYFPYSPYNCAPYGYYGPQWFTSGIFIGAGPWFHGPRDFHGYINRQYDPRYGYRGRLPSRGTRGTWHPDPNFHSSTQFNGQGRAWHGNSQPANRGHANEHSRPNNQGHANNHGHANNRGNDHGNQGNHGNGHGNHGNGH